MCGWYLQIMNFILIQNSEHFQKIHVGKAKLHKQLQANWKRGTSPTANCLPCTNHLATQLKVVKYFFGTY